jgi:hypothetical protein
MSDWNGISWVQQDWVLPFLFSFLTVALIGAVVWFVDGVGRYGYWLHDEEEIEGEEEEDR